MKPENRFTHLLFIDPLEKLSFQKDSSLQLALTLKEQGKSVFLVFEEDFSFSNKGEGRLKGFPFRGSFEANGCYLKNFEVDHENGEWLSLNASIILHMRIDPPFDSRYLRYLWILRSLKQVYGINVLNDPEGIAAHNEKMVCFESENSVETFVGSSVEGFKSFISALREGDYRGLILKPLDLFQGIGVEKIDKEVNLEETISIFKKKSKEYEGPVVAQPFLEEVYEGEIRALYFDGVELGSIIKIPPKGEFLANIARGAHYEKVELDSAVREQCEEMSKSFSSKGVPWLAFDILGGKVQEANLTCPGLLVEVSKACERNLAVDLVSQMESYLGKS